VRRAYSGEPFQGRECFGPRAVGLLEVSSRQRGVAMRRLALVLVLAAGFASDRVAGG